MLEIKKKDDKIRQEILKIFFVISEASYSYAEFLIKPSLRNRKDLVNVININLSGWNLNGNSIKLQNINR